MNDQLPLINCPSSSARQSEGFVNLRSWVQIPPRAYLDSFKLIRNHSGDIFEVSEVGFARRYKQTLSEFCRIDKINKNS